MRKSGILVHPTSFPSQFGIGDLGECARDFVDYLVKANMKLWQILPMGHTSFGNSPYQSFSTFAGNPILISPQILLEKGYLLEEDINNIPNFSENRVEFGTVIEFKNKIFEKAYTSFSKLKGGKKTAYNKFCLENGFWLEDYALFMSLKDYFIQDRKNTFESAEYKKYYELCKDNMDLNLIKDCFYGGAWSSFPIELRDRNEKAMAKWSAKLKNEIGYYKFLQFEFFEQWHSLKKYANENGIDIIGDIPIFVALDSADTWAGRELFMLDENGFATEVTGVPPDYFSEDGQLWGNPQYNWAAHKKEDYAWWVQRVESVLNMVDIVRIDHFRAFDTYWSIPFGEVTAKNGKWKKGPKKAVFRAITQRLGTLDIIAEDLGDLNEDVIKLRDDLGLPGMKILQFAFDEPGNEYLPHNYKSDNFVVYTGTHDNDTVIGWYNNTDEETRDYVRRYLNVSGEDINWDMIRLALQSSAMYAVIPIQDILGYGEECRMNTPGVKGGNWEFRYTDNALTDESAEKLKYLNELFNR